MRQEIECTVRNIDELLTVDFTYPRIVKFEFSSEIVIGIITTCDSFKVKIENGAPRKKDVNVFFENLLIKFGKIRHILSNWDKSMTMSITFNTPFIPEHFMEVLEECFSFEIGEYLAAKTSGILFID